MFKQSWISLLAGIAMVPLGERAAATELTILWAEWDPADYLQELANEYGKKTGDKITASLNPLRDGTTGGLLTQVTLASGKVLGNGPGRGPAQPAAPARGAAK